METKQTKWVDSIVNKVTTTADKNGIIRVNVTLLFAHNSNEELTRELISSQAATILVSFKPPDESGKGG